MPITRTMNRVWFSDQPESIYEALTKSFLEHNQGFTEVRWTLADVLSIPSLSDDAKQVLSSDTIHWILKSDIARYAILASDGGWYADMDFEFSGSIEEYCQDELFLEISDRGIGNALIGARPRHPILESARDTAVKNVLGFDGQLDPHSVYRLTGPWMFHKCVVQHRKSIGRHRCLGISKTGWTKTL